MSGLLLDPALAERFAAIVGDANALCGDVAAGYLSEPRDKYHAAGALVLRPGRVEEVSAILSLANETATGIVPQAGNTGLVGGQIPVDPSREVVVSLTRLDTVRDVDAVDNSMIVEAGVTLAEARAAAAEAERLFPLSVASQGSCRIGGNLATNAGGVNVLAYGSMRELCLGLEVVLADGRVWEGLGRLRKDNTGYDLKDLFIGSEGTLGVITAASLKLYPGEHDNAVAWCGLASPQAALDLLHLAQGAGGRVVALELVPRIGLEFTIRHAGARDPLSAPHPWYGLVELAGGSRQEATSDALGAILASAAQKGIIADAVIATSQAQASQLWHIRESLSEVQKLEGGSIKHDIAVPVSATPRFIAEATAAVANLIPGARPVPFGHIGDGNIHFNVSQPEGGDRQAFLDRWEEIAKVVHDIALGLGGTISAEHGIGQMKREDMKRIKSAVELDLMAAIKKLLDPNGILNPGKLLP